MVNGFQIAVIFFLFAGLAACDQDASPEKIGALRSIPADEQNDANEAPPLEETPQKNSETKSSEPLASHEGLSLLSEGDGVTAQWRKTKGSSLVLKSFSPINGSPEAGKTYAKGDLIEGAEVVYTGDSPNCTLPYDHHGKMVYLAVYAAENGQYSKKPLKGQFLDFKGELNERAALAFGPANRLLRGLFQSHGDRFYMGYGNYTQGSSGEPTLWAVGAKGKPIKGFASGKPLKVGEGVMSHLLVNSKGQVMAAVAFDTNETEGQSFFLKRFHKDGKPDQDFGKNGRLDFAGSNQKSRDDLLQLVLGAKDQIFALVATDHFGFYGVRLVRYHHNGTGLVSITPPKPLGALDGLASDAKNRLWLFRNSAVAQEVYRFDGNASLDSNFGQNGGIRLVSPENSASTLWRKALMSADGGAYLLGNILRGGDYSFMVLKLKDNGEVDASFGNTFGGYYVHNGPSAARDALVSSDGRLVIGANHKDGTGEIWFLNPDGTIATTIGKDGVIKTDRQHPVRQLILYNDHRIYSGHFELFQNSNLPRQLKMFEVR